MTPKPGIYNGVPFEEYRTWDAAHKSSLVAGERSMAHVKAADEEHEPTPAMELGAFVHSYILEPETLLDRYVSPPPMDRRTKEGKAEYAAFVAGSDGKKIVNREHLELAKGMRAGVYANPEAVRYLTGDREVSILWDDITPCKARLDVYGDAMCDLKTTVNASPAGFPAEAARYKYHVQAAMYQHGVNVLTGDVLPFIIVAVEKSPPFACAVYRFDDEALQVGWDIYRRLLDEFAACRKHGRWPGYQHKLQTLSLPMWAVRREDTEADF